MADNNQQPQLFDNYPELKKEIRHLPLGEFPTPVHQLKNLGFNNLWIKRDDLTSSIYGGNKVRKLEFILAEVLRRNKKRIVTTGGTGTHHGLATAIFAQQFGIDVTLLLYDQPYSDEVRHNLLLLAGQQVKIVHRKTLWKTMFSYLVLCRIIDPFAYFLYPGGSNVFGTLGYVNAVLELKTQIESGLLPKPDVIFCPLGSNGTMAGLILGCALSKLDSEIIGVRVTPPKLGVFQACTDHTVMKLAKDTCQLLRQNCRDLPWVNLKTPTIDGRYLGNGYGCKTESCIEAIEIMNKNEGIQLDQTYTAKAFSAVSDFCSSPENRSKTVLYWHTYNSVDTSHLTVKEDYLKLPATLHHYFGA